MAAARALRSAVILRLETAVAQVGGRVKTEPIEGGTPTPYLIVSNYSERPGAHYGGAGAYDDGFDVRGVARLKQGDRPLLSLWEDTEAALQDVPIAVDGHQDVIGTLRLMGTFPSPLDSSLWTFAARYEALAIVA